MTQHDRLHALDAARAFALLLGIALHATMSFFMPLPATDVSQSTTLAVTFFVIHVFRMSLFFFIAGFFAHMVFHRRGLRRFAKDRAKRILVPMTAGWIILAPATIATVVWGLTKSFPDGAPADLASAAPTQQSFPLTHLWFLYYLCIFYIAALTLRAGFVGLLDRSGVLRKRIDGAVRICVTGFLAPAILAAPICAVLVANTSWPVWFGIQTPDTGLTPQLPALVGFGTAFTFGWVVHRQLDLLGTLRKQWLLNLLGATALTAACLYMVGLTPNLLVPSPFAEGSAERLVYYVCYTLAIWYWTFGLLGAALKFCDGASPLRRYVADSSYWLYLAHLPIVFALQVLLMDVPLHWAIKFPLIVTVAMTVLLVSYHYLVRPTFIGQVLNGRRYPRKARRPEHEPDPGAPRGRRSDKSNTAPADEHGAAGVALLSGVTKRYGDTTALDDITLNVQQGELLAVLGPNGAGKSTAISLWLGLLEPDAGDVRIRGGSPLEPSNRLGLGVMMQDAALPAELTGRELIAQAASYYPAPLTIDEVIDLTGIGDIADKRYSKLSGGQKRQIQFAVAVCGRPDTLFLDEPTVGLDIRAREAMWRTIRDLLLRGCSIVLTTHYLEEAEALADRVAVLAGGRIIAEGTVEEMRSLVERRRIRCASVVAVDDVCQWPGVVDAERDNGTLSITAFDAEAVVRRLLAADEQLSQLEIKQASLAEAFQEITKEAA